VEEGAGNEKGHGLDHGGQDGRDVVGKESKGVDGGREGGDGPVMIMLGVVYIENNGHWSMVLSADHATYRRMVVI